jgi:hypothetical protein
MRKILRNTHKIEYQSATTLALTAKITKKNAIDSGRFLVLSVDPAEETAATTL